MKVGAVALGLVLGVTACGSRASHEAREDPELAPLGRLYALQSELRASMRPEALVARGGERGPDPTAIVALADGAGFVGLATGAGEIELFDPELRVVARARVPVGSRGLALGPGRSVATASEDRVLSFRVEGASLEALAPRVAKGAVDLVDVAFGERGDLHAIDATTGALVSWPVDAKGALVEAPLVGRAGEGPFRVARAGAFVVVASLFEHAVIARPVDARGAPIEGRDARVVHDGPIWSFSALADRDGLLLATGGVEDHPLDRSGGSFGFVDSFVWIDRLAPGAPPERRFARNVSELSVLTPKSIELARAGAGLRLAVSGYGGDALAAIDLDERFAPTRVDTRTVTPGIASIARGPRGLVAANTLADAWVALPDAGGELFYPTSAPPNDPAARDRRVGELLFYTRLMAPWNKTDGALSRFTCETCHFEGYVDGRTHRTGRGEIVATTKPLVGLLVNRPHFSRALDPDLVAVVYNEFKVAGANSGHDPWFSIGPAELPWLARFGVERALSPEDLRRGLLAYLAATTYPPNPRARGRTTFTDREREGARLFADRCEPCHEARVVSDDASTRVAASAWETLIFERADPIVWGTERLAKTGIEPYVNDAGGARVPSLRRLAKKRPYFTNGSARTLDDVLAAARFATGEGVAGFAHRGDGRALGSDERARLRDFLDLL